LARLLRFPSDRAGTAGYRSFKSYSGIGIDEQGRYIKVSDGRVEVPAGPESRNAPKKLTSLEWLFSPVETERPPKVRKFKKGDSAKVKVLKVEESGRRYLLQCKDSGQDDIVIETNYVWNEGDMKGVKVVQVDGEGRIKAVRFP
jgi:hypothetical protein